MKVVLLTFSLYLITGIGYSQCQNFTMTLIGNDPVCHDYSDGSITINTSGGNGNLAYAITDSSGNFVTPIPGGTPNTLPGGWYWVEVTDDSSCYLMDSVFLFNPPPILAQISFVDPSSLTACDGIATVDTVINNQGSYANISYWWTGGPGGVGENVKDDLCNDFYELIINDAIGCSYYEEIASGSARLPVEEISFTVYPNPTAGKLNIESNGQKILKFELFDLSGKLIIEFDQNDGLNISSVKTGHYVLAITSESATCYTQILKE